MRELKFLSATFFLISVFLLSNPLFAEAQGKPSSIEERLIRLEEGQKALNQRLDSTNKRIDDFRQDTNTRFAELRQDMNERFANLEKSVDERFNSVNERFDSINKRFDDLQFWLQLIFGAVVLVLAGLIAQWLLMWRKLIKVETAVEEHLAETEKDRLIAFQREEIEMLKARLDKLEAGTA